MVLFNYSTKEITAKVVYYGPGLCGKTTNLQFIYDNLPGNIQRGRMLSLATKTDRTLFFDFLPIDLGTIRGMRTRVQLYTVPGQVFYNSTRKLVLKGADGIVFVADSQEKMKDANLESFHNLEENCVENGINLPETPLVLQFNKRDLPGVASLEELNNVLNKYNAPFYESVATTGIGVHESLKAITKLVLHSLREKYAGAEKAPKRPKAPPMPVPMPTPAPMEEAPLVLEEEAASAAVVPVLPEPIEPLALEDSSPPATEVEPLVLEDATVGEEPISLGGPASPGTGGGADLESVFAEAEAEVEELDLEEDAVIGALGEVPAAAAAAPTQEPVVEGLLSVAEPDGADASGSESFADLAAEIDEAPKPPPIPISQPVVDQAPAGFDADPLGLGGVPPEDPGPGAITLRPGTEDVEIPLEIDAGGEVQRYRLRLHISLTRED